MRAPLCFCNGVIRSGSTWSFNVCRGLFQELALQRNQPFGSTYLEGRDVERFVSEFWSTAPGPTVIKAHMIGDGALTAMRTGDAKAVCTFRDPRDCVASDIKFMGLGMETSVKRVASSLEFLKLYQFSPAILLVKYEEMMRDRVGQVRRIAVHLGMNPDQAMLDRVDAKTNIDSSKKLCTEIKARPADQVLHIASHKVDPVTHLHDQHIGDARSGKWRDEFSVAQARWLTEYFAPWLVQLGYETSDSVRQILSTVHQSPERHVLQPAGTFASGHSFSTGLGSTRFAG